MPQVTGIVTVFINGTQQRSMEGAKLITGGMERTAVMANRGIAGYAEKPVPAQVEFTLPHMADTDLMELNDLVEATVKFETDTGLSYLIANAFTTKPTELTGGEGEVTMEMQGDAALEE